MIRMDEEEKQRILEHPCMKCEMVKWKFPHPIYVCGVDDHEAIAIIGLEQALDHLLQDCPKKEDEELSLNVNVLGGGLLTTSKLYFY